MTKFKDISTQQYEPTVEDTILTHKFEYGDFEKVNRNKIKVAEFDSIVIIDYTDKNEALFSCTKGVSTSLYKGVKGKEFL